MRPCAERDPVVDADTYLAEMITVDSNRASALARIDDIKAAFEAVAARDQHGKHIPYWLRLDVLRKA